MLNLNEHRPPHAPPAPPVAPYSLQLGEGQFFTGLRWAEATTCGQLAEMIADRLLSREGVLGATAAGGSFTIRPVVHPLHGNAGYPPTLGDRVFCGWDAVLEGKLCRSDPGSLALLLGGAECLQVGQRTELLPRNGPEEPCVEDLCWVGDTLRGFVLIELRNARSVGGAALAFAAGREGDLPFRFQAACEGPGAEAPPFRLVFFEELPEDEERVQ